MFFPAANLLAWSLRLFSLSFFCLHTHNSFPLLVDISFVWYYVIWKERQTHSLSSGMIMTMTMMWTWTIVSLTFFQLNMPSIKGCREKEVEYGDFSFFQMEWVCLTLLLFLHLTSRDFLDNNNFPPICPCRSPSDALLSWCDVCCSFPLSFFTTWSPSKTRHYLPSYTLSTLLLLGEGVYVVVVVVVVVLWLWFSQLE